MIFHKFGDKRFLYFLLEHAEDKSWWNYLQHVPMLSDKCHIILPILDNHGGEYQKRLHFD